MSKTSLRSFQTSVERRKYLEAQLNISLSQIELINFDESSTVGRNIENLIGSTQIPLGVAGPIRLKADMTDYYIPLATTEGALVASISRGAKAILESDGAKVIVDEVGITRGPVFKTSGIEQSHQLADWVNSNFLKLSEVTQSTSRYLKLLKIDPAIVGTNVYLRFYFDTSDAMGMNMATIACEKAVELIETATGAECVTLAGNYDIDKKPAWLNFSDGRGKRSWAEVLLPKSVIEQTLKTTAAEIADIVYRKCLLGSAMAGSMGFNAHYANIVAAIFLATGQDIAHVVEAASGITTAEIVGDGNLLFSIYIPSLQLGTVGGGTWLPSQQEALKILGVNGTGKVKQFTKLVLAAVLAGEISLIASQAEGSLAKAHRKHGRNGQ
jgi:hydroxymethylglutaryl-CoA reductase (NADPH)